MISPIAAKTSSSRWVDVEFSGLGLGDERRNKRMRAMLKDMVKHPSGSLPEMHGDKASIKAAYRMLHNESVDYGDVLFCHANKSLERASRALAGGKNGPDDVLLLIQDTTQIDYSSHYETEGLGTMQTPKCRGILAHGTIAASGVGEVFGLVDLQQWVRDPRDFGKHLFRKSLPIQSKESYKWLLSVQAMRFLEEKLPDQPVVFVADREADIYSLFAQPRPHNHHLLIRASHNRALAEEDLKLWPFMEAQPSLGRMSVEVGGNGKRKRRAQLSVRAAPVQLRSPGSDSTAPKTVSVWAVYAHEEVGPNSGKGDKPISWMLLSTLPVTSGQDAERRVRWYTQRWKIEMFHRILKSGCKVEECRLGDATSLMHYILLQSIVACRVLFCMTVGREHPERPCTELLKEDEWQALYCATHKTGRLPNAPPSLGEAIVWIARLVGYTGNPSRTPPGAQLIQKGFERLADIALGYTLFKATL